MDVREEGPGEREREREEASKRGWAEWVRGERDETSRARL